MKTTIKEHVDSIYHDLAVDFPHTDFLFPTQEHVDAFRDVAEVVQTITDDAGVVCKQYQYEGIKIVLNEEGKLHDIEREGKWVIRAVGAHLHLYRSREESWCDGEFAYLHQESDHALSKRWADGKCTVE